MKNVLVIGIAGKSGSGKTTVAEEFVDCVDSHDIEIIRFDDYYKNQDHLTYEERVKTNYDHPEAFDIELLIGDIKKLKDGVPINKPTYDFVNHTRKKEYQAINPRKIIVIEGLFTLLEPKVRKLLDMKVFVDTDDDDCLIRRITRDMNERGREYESIIDQYLTCVKPMAQQFIEPTRKYADVIILHGGGNQVAINLVKAQLNEFINKEK